MMARRVALTTLSREAPKLSTQEPSLRQVQLKSRWDTLLDKFSKFDADPSLLPRWVDKPSLEEAGPSNPVIFEQAAMQVNHPVQRVPKMIVGHDPDDYPVAEIKKLLKPEKVIDLKRQKRKKKTKQVHIKPAGRPAFKGVLVKRKRRIDYPCKDKTKTLRWKHVTVKAHKKKVLKCV